MSATPPTPPTQPTSPTPPTSGTPPTPGTAGEPADPDALIVAVDGYSGPFDVLLALARKQQVDLTRIAVLPLVEQYLAFLDAALARRLDLAADYLVTASWLAYLKSRLLLPTPSEPEAEEAQAMAHLPRLQSHFDPVGMRCRRGQDILDNPNGTLPRPLVRLHHHGHPQPRADILALSSVQPLPLCLGLPH